MARTAAGPRADRLQIACCACSSYIKKGLGKLLEGNLRALLLDLCLDGLGLFLGDAFFDVLGSALDERKP